MRALRNFFSGQRPASAPRTENARADHTSSAADGTGVFAYPPVDPGIPVRSIDDVLAAQDDLIRRIKLSYGSDRNTFNADLFSLIRRYAEYVHLLPATPDNHFSLPGGLLRMGLEIAFYALQATDGQIFSGRSTISHRRQLEPRWRHATFIAGLCSELHRTLSHVIVIDAKGNEWPAYLGPLNDWLHAQRTSRFFLRWIPHAQETRSLGVFALPQIVAPETLDYLAQGNSVVVPHMMACVSGMPIYREHNILEDLVRRAAALVIDRDLQSSAERYGKPRLGSHLERYLVDALRRLVVSNVLWMPNAEKSRVWYGADGLYIVWPNAANDVRKLLEADQLPGIPKAPETLLEIFIEAGVVEPSGGTETTWHIFPPHCDKAIEAIRLASPSILLAAMDRPPEPLPYTLVKPRPESRAAPTSAAASSVHSGQTIELPLALPAAPDSPSQPFTPVSAAQQRPASVVGDQLELSVASSSPAGPTGADLSPRRPTFSLTAPLRLDAPLRAALGDVVDSFNHDGAHVACCPTPTGLFIPLAEFERRAIEPALAMRALADASMLVSSSSSKTKPVTQYFGGEAKAGLVIHPRFIAGFEHADFQGTPTEGDANAAS
jgi:conjugal transfer pilus assembly protein TraI